MLSHIYNVILHNLKVKGRSHLCEMREEWARTAPYYNSARTGRICPNFGVVRGVIPNTRCVYVDYTWDWSRIIQEWAVLEQSGAECTPTTRRNCPYTRRKDPNVFHSRVVGQSFEHVQNFCPKLRSTPYSPVYSGLLRELPRKTPRITP